MDNRTDGLLQGSREERCEQMAALKNAEWSLETLLNLHIGLLDHAEDVQHEALDVLREIAKRNPEPITLTPLAVLGLYFKQLNFGFLCDFGTPESLSLAQKILTTDILNGSNADFEATLKHLVKKGRLDVLEPLNNVKLSEAKSKILGSVLRTSRGKENEKA